MEKATAAMHALNRRAKEKRDRAKRYRRSSFARRVLDELETIYDLKNRFLGAVVEAKLARVRTFSVAGRTLRPEWMCEECDRSWVGDDECHRCGCPGEQIDPGGQTVDVWYVVDVAGYSFHQPSDLATEEMRRSAEPTEAHDPTQPQREIPNVGLTIDAQKRCIEMAIERLRRVRRKASTKTRSHTRRRHPPARRTGREKEATQKDESEDQPIVRRERDERERADR